MIKNLNPFVLSETQEEDSEIAEWAFQSHYWVEEYAGYYKCKWCNTTHSGMMGITKDFPSYWRKRNQ